MSYAVQQFFLNGGRQAIIVRCAHLRGRREPGEEIDLHDRRRRRTRSRSRPRTRASGATTCACGSTTTRPGRDRRSSTCDQGHGTGEIEMFRNLTRPTADADYAQRVLASRRRWSAMTAVAGRRGRPPNGAPAPAATDPFDDRSATALAGRRRTAPDAADLVPALGATDRALRARSGRPLQPPLHPADRPRRRRSPVAARRAGVGLLRGPPRALHRRPGPDVDSTAGRRAREPRRVRGGHARARTRRSTSRTCAHGRPGLGGRGRRRSRRAARSPA